MELLIELNWDDWDQLKKNDTFALREEDFTRNFVEMDYIDGAIATGQLVSGRIFKSLLSPAKRKIFEPNLLPLEARKFTKITNQDIYGYSSNIVLAKIEVPEDQILSVNAEVWDDFEIKIMDYVGQMVDTQDKFDLENLTQRTDKLFNQNILNLFNLDNAMVVYFIGKIDLEQVDFVQYTMNGNIVKIDHPAKLR